MGRILTLFLLATVSSSFSVSIARDALHSNALQARASNLIKYTTWASQQIDIFKVDIKNAVESAVVTIVDPSLTLVFQIDPVSEEIGNDDFLYFDMTVGQDMLPFNTSSIIRWTPYQTDGTRIELFNNQLRPKSGQEATIWTCEVQNINPIGLEYTTSGNQYKDALFIIAGKIWSQCRVV